MLSYKEFVIDSMDWLTYKEMDTLYPSDEVYCFVRNREDGSKQFQPKVLITYCTVKELESIIATYGRQGNTTTIFQGTNFISDGHLIYLKHKV